MCHWRASSLLFIPKGCNVLALFIKDVRAHCYCASLIRTLYTRHARATSSFQARAPSRNSTKYRANDLCVNLVCEYFCWVLGAPPPPLFFSRSLPFLMFSIILKNKKIYTWQVLIFLIQFSNRAEFVHG